MTSQPETHTPALVSPSQAPERTHRHHVTYQGGHYLARRGGHGNPLDEVALLAEVTEQGSFIAWLPAPRVVAASAVSLDEAGLRFPGTFLSLACQACGAGVGEECRDWEGWPWAEFHEYRQAEFWAQNDPTVHVRDGRGHLFSAKLHGLDQLRLRQDLDALEDSAAPVLLDLVVDASGYTFEDYAAVLLLRPLDPEW